MGKWKRRKKYSVLPKVEEESSFASSFRLTKLLKREMVVTAVSVLFVSTIILGSSYAVLTNIDKAEDYNVVKTGTLQIAYDDTSEGLGNIIRLNGAYPESDEEGQKREPYRFKITNTGSIPAEYNVKILDDSSMIEEDGCQNKLLDKTRLKYSIDGGDPVILSTMGEEYIVATDTLGEGESVVLEIRMWIDIESGNEVLGKHYHGKIVVEGVQSKGALALKILKGKINDTSITYDNATEEEKKKMFTFSHTAGEQQTGWSEEELTDYRYVGTTPNNYVTFNDEVWRIIGIFTVEDEYGSKEQRLKIIRDESIGIYSWDNKSNVGSSISQYGSNDWSDSRLQQMLNEGPYYHRTTGNCPFGNYDKTKTCNFISNGLTDEAKSMIEKVKWYLGSESSSSFSAYPANYYYISERGTNVSPQRPTNWIGNVGLIYKSDYGYAAGTNSCLNTNLRYYSSGCMNNNWLFNATHQWLITPHTLSKAHDYVNKIDADGSVSVKQSYETYQNVRPAVYLSTTLFITSGDGSSNNPYRFAISL